MDSDIVQIGTEGEWQLVAHGNANALFRQVTPTSQLNGKLLRIRRKDAETRAVFSYWKENILPIFGEHCAQMELVRIDTKYFHDKFPQIVEQSHDSYALIIEDLKSEACDLLLEFKPKWLAESPNGSAPSRNCRTCALNAQRKKTWICPLDLVSLNKNVRVEAVRKLIKLQNQNVDFANQITNYLDETGILGKIKSIQELDTRGILSYTDSEEVDSDFLLAMACRDCTMFIKALADGTVTVKLVDFDLKDPKRKREHWKNVELSLDYSVPCMK